MLVGRHRLVGAAALAVVITLTLVLVLLRDDIFHGGKAAKLKNPPSNSTMVMDGSKNYKDEDASSDATKGRLPGELGKRFPAGNQTASPTARKPGSPTAPLLPNTADKHTVPVTPPTKSNGLLDGVLDIQPGKAPILGPNELGAGAGGPTTPTDFVKTLTGQGGAGAVAGSNKVRSPTCRHIVASRHVWWLAVICVSSILLARPLEK